MLTGVETTKMQKIAYPEVRNQTYDTRYNISGFALKDICIVDDDVFYLDVGRRALTPHYKVRAFKSGTHLLKALKHFIPDLILLDIVMPEMDGFETILHLKGNERTRHIPVIFLSSNIDEQSEQKAMTLGATDYLHKPYSSHMLRKYLQLFQRVPGVCVPGGRFSWHTL